MDIVKFGINTLTDVVRGGQGNTPFSSNDVLKLRSSELLFKTVNNKRFAGYNINYHHESDVVGLYNEIFCYKIYDFKSYDPLPYIIDGGANIGMATLRFKQLYPYARVVSFEPQHRVFQVLQKNMLNNNIKNVELVNKALSDTDENIDFFISRDNLTDCGASVDSMSHDDKISVPCTKLSHYFDQLVDLLKLDIGGSEYPVLKELEESGKLKLARNIILEYHPVKDKFGQPNGYLIPILELLRRNGYVADIRIPYDLGGEMNRYIYKKQDGLYFFMIYAVPIERATEITSLGSYACTKGAGQ
jgi:FkbM family methyltransferase